MTVPAATTNSFPTRQLGRNGPHVSAIGLGTMGIGIWYGKTDHEAANEALTYAADHGVTFWDTADVYGDTEEVLGRWFTSTGRRADIFLATKFGSWDPEAKYAPPYTPVSTPSYVKHAVQRSLARLQTSYIDLYYQHRVDPSVPIEVVMEALREYVEDGRIRWVGLSECSGETLRRAKKVEGVGERVVVVQDEYSPFSLQVEREGFANVCEELGVGIVAYSPLGRGMVSGRYRSRADFDADDSRLIMPRFSEENFPKNLALVDGLKVIAEKYGATTSQVTLAWILAEHPTFIPIPGSRSKERVEENAKGALLELKPEDVKEIRKLCEEAEIHGERYPEEYMAGTKGDCIALGEWKGE
ncbi:Aldo/keto reductase [Schizopora paradoxa]|uniref:Aldo/keto reductase n=1 Tax=Schizopora paradoxa TaxID=27342 RepID=A0A0H2REB8_9AGAM|nr:Aldo/keto reductase [Schizopora paradoxa]